MKRKLSTKSDYTCSYCNKIFKDPIILPCSDNICAHHLKEENVLKQNRIECVDCKRAFKIKGNDFGINKLAKKFLDDEMYLSEDEKSAKEKIEESLRELFRLHDQLTQNKIKCDLACSNRFQEIRFKIDKHRDELKEKIDEISLQMIDQVKAFERQYTTNNDLTTTAACLKSFDQEMQDLSEKLRDPNILLDDIRQIEQKQEANLAILKFKLNEMNKIKDHLQINRFEPQLFSCTNFVSFGRLSLSEYSSLFKSPLLRDDSQVNELIKLCEFGPSDKWTLLYRGSRDGIDANGFHSKCDGHSSTLTIVKVKRTEFIFGGYTDVPWDSSSGRKSDANAFVFSLTNKDEMPCKLRTSRSAHSIYCSSQHGPTFGLYDIAIANNANASSNLGDVYKHPKYAFKSNEARAFLAGAEYFQLSEIEVYSKKSTL